jgi:hypothetical protein
VPLQYFLLEDCGGAWWWIICKGTGGTGGIVFCAVAAATPLFVDAAPRGAAILFLLIIAPDIYWHVNHGVPFVEHMRELADSQLVNFSRWVSSSPSGYMSGFTKRDTMLPCFIRPCWHSVRYTWTTVRIRVTDFGDR